MQETNRRIVTKEETSFTELLDNREGIILDLENLHYFTLNGSAVLIWKILRNGSSVTPEDLAAQVASAFDIDRHQALAEAGAFLDELKAHGLIGFAEETESPKRVAVETGGLPVYEPPTMKVSESLSSVALSGSSTVATAAISTGGNG